MFSRCIINILQVIFYFLFFYSRRTAFHANNSSTSSLAILEISFLQVLHLLRSSPIHHWPSHLQADPTTYVFVFSPRYTVELCEYWNNILCRVLHSLRVSPAHEYNLFFSLLIFFLKSIILFYLERNIL